MVLIGGSNKFPLILVVDHFVSVLKEDKIIFFLVELTSSYTDIKKWTLTL